MRKICAITANRADFSRLETILNAVKKHQDLELRLVVMGSHLLKEKGETVNEIIKSGFKPDYTIQMEVAGGTPAAMTKSTGLAILELSTVLDQLRPDIVIVPVDRFESLAMGVTAALMNVRVAHIQGGEVTGTIDESIRHALTKLSHWHFVATAKSRERVIKMGESAETVFNVGCPATDLLLRAPVWDKKTTVSKLNELISGENKLDVEKPYILMMQHPVTTEFGSAGEQIKASLSALESLDEQIIILWPNIDAGSEEISNILKERVRVLSAGHIFAHLPTEIFVNVLRHASCQVGNSSSGIRESCYFGTPAVNIGSRQNTRERGGNVIDVGYNTAEIIKAIRTQLEHGRYPVEMIYGDGRAGEKIAEILAFDPLPPIQKIITY